MRCLLPLYEILLPEAIMSVARSRLIQRFGRDWMIYALFHCGVEYLISQNSGFWDSLYLGSEGGIIVAYCLYRDDGEHYYMRQLFVARGHRRRGIATKLLNWMYKNIWADKKVRLDVLAYNEEAVAFYRAFGFRIGCLRMEK